MTLDKLKNIVWDVDGTLFDTYPAIVNSFAKALEHYGIPSDKSSLMQLALQSLSHCVRILAAEHDLDEDAFGEKFVSYYDEIEYADQPPFPHVVEVCERIRSLGGRNVIVTHRGTSGTTGLLAAHAMTPLFTGWITWDDGFPRKPDPSAFKAALERFGLQPDETLSIGDRNIDTEAAHAAGLKTCRFAQYGSGEDTPDLIIKDFSELLDLLT